MYTTWALQQLLVALAMLSMVQASWLDKAKFEPRAVLGRQISDIIGGAGSSSSAKADSQSKSIVESSVSVPSSTTSSQDVSITSASAPASTNLSSNPPASAPSTTSPTQSAAEVTSPVAPQSTSSNFQWTPAASSSSPPTTATPIVSTKIEVHTSTLSDGSKATLTTTTKTTSTPGLSSGDGETSGMTSKTRNTVIGVVVGVGGAIVLGALALVAWRIWGRKKHNEENDGLMDYDMSASGGAEKSERGSSAGGAQRTPFQSTLENYHQPNQVNASSNF